MFHSIHPTRAFARWIAAGFAFLGLSALASAAEGPKLYSSYSFNREFTDDSGCGHHLATPGNPSFTTDRFGAAANAVYFDGMTQYAKYGPMRGLINPADPNAGSVSLMGWFRSGDKSGRDMMLFGFGRAEYRKNFQVGIQNNQFRVNGWGGPYDWLTGMDATGLLDGKWHSVAVTYDRTAQRTVLYLDGVFRCSTDDYRFDIDPNDSYTVIGSEIDESGWMFQGAIDDFKAFSGVLSWEDIRTFHAIELMSERDLQAGYLFNGNARDFSPRQLDGIANCTPATNRFGSSNSAVHFNGYSNDVHSAGTLNGFPGGNSPKSISGWFKSSDRSGKDLMLFGFGCPNYGNNFQVGICWNTFRVNGWGSSYDWWTGFDATPFLNDAWHHCVVTYDGTSTSLYIDGARRATTTDFRFNTEPGKSRVVIGREIDLSGWEWNGDLDDIRVYSRCMSIWEVGDQYLYSSLIK